MNIRVVTDSTSDLPQHLVETHHIEVVPALLILDGKQYADGIGISRQDFYTQLPRMKVFPTTAAPSVGEFAERFRKLFKAGCDHIISVHAAHQLTTIINSARMASQEFGDRVTVIDSGSLSLGLGFQVLAAVEAIAEGLGLDRIIEAIKTTRTRGQVMAALDTMEYLKRSGRVPGAVAAIGGMLNIKPIVELLDGVVKPMGATRTTRQGGQRMYDAIRALGPLEHLALLHTNAEARARQLLDELMQTVSQSIPRDIMILNVTTVIGTHVGPNGLGFAAVKVS